MSVLYTCGNKNLSTVRLVASANLQLIQQNQSSPLKKIVLFLSPEIYDTEIFTKQAKIYRNILGESLRIEIVPLNNDGFGTSEDLKSVFNNNFIKYIDITNGQKTATAQLYFTASLLRLKNIYYASLKVNPQEIPELPIFGEHYEYIQVPSFDEITDLSRISYFDLIFYLEEIDMIFSNLSDNSFLQRVKNDLRKSILSFFQGDNYRSAVSDATTSSETLINEALKFLKIYEPAKSFSKIYDIDFDKQKDPLGAISFFFRIYSEKSSQNKKYLDPNLEAMITIPSLLTPLRTFRNIASHSGISPHQFQVNEVRICANLALEIFRCAKSSNEFWKRLSQIR